MATEQDIQLEEKRRRLSEYVGTGASSSSANGVNHVAVFAKDLEATAEFYSLVLGMPVTGVVPNRDEPGSTHMLVDVGNGVSLAFFDFPHVPRIQVPVEEGVGGVMHIAIAIRPERYQEVEARLNQRGVGYQRIDNSIYIRDPNGLTIELLILGQ